MKSALRRVFAPILNIFEAGDEEYAYSPSHRKILLVVGSLFLFLCAGISGVGLHFGQGGAVIPAVVFLGLGSTSIIVGTLGTDRAVAKIWGNKPSTRR